MFWSTLANAVDLIDGAFLVIPLIGLAHTATLITGIMICLVAYIYHLARNTKAARLR